ncbi:hypothetical protein IQ07DRAFT_584367 [Pyrenochaeta sp. DS3sAY3a]|nr:hypothetical protein IQ07DRAFT_584367 [Pyrenochaeta sp. DS3sAY3a]
MASLAMRTILFATAATAQTTQFTTSIWMLKDGWTGATELGYYGSIISANRTHTAYELSYDNGTNFEALRIFDRDQRLTVTANPTEFKIANFDITENPSGYNYRCEQPSTSWTGNATCTIFVGASVADEYFCQPTTTTSYNATSTRTILNTFSGRGTESGGVETILHTLRFFTYTDPDTQTEFSEPPYSSTSSPPAGWCSSKSKVGDDYADVFPAPQSQFGVFQVVVTAGIEKLAAVTGASASPSLPASTGGAAGGGLGGQQGVVGSLGVFAAPVVAGLAVGAAAVLL